MSRKLNVDKTLKVLPGLRQLYRRILLDLHRDVSTFEMYIKSREDLIFLSESYKKLPRWAISELSGYADAYYEIVENSLFYTHVLDGERLISRLPESDKKLEGRYTETVGSCYCFGYVLTEDGEEQTILVPWHERNREKDIHNGLLSEEVIHKLRSYRNNVKLIVPGHHRNGSLYIRTL